MLHKKYSVKENLALGKADVKKIRGEFTSRLGEQFTDFCDSVWDKKASAQRRRWQVNTYSSANIFLINGVPLLISVDGFPEDAGNLLKECDTSALLPTVFLLLKAQLFYQSNTEAFNAFLHKLGSSVVCRGPTSRFLMAGAHLMMPGVVGVSESSEEGVGDASLISSLGRSCPYGVGYCTSQMSEDAETGVGVYIVHTYADNLWKEFRDVFISSCGPGVECIPPYFEQKEVTEDLPAFLAEQHRDAAGDESKTEEKKTDIPDGVVDDAVPERVTADNEVAETEEENPQAADVTEAHADLHEQVTEKKDESAGVSSDNEAPSDTVKDIDVASLFSDTDSVLNFSLCQTVLSVSQSRLPLPVAQFTSALVLNYPRGLPNQGAIDFKETPHKKALAFLKAHTDIVTVSEVRKGVHEITALNRSSLMMREHKKKYADYITHVYSPALLMEAKEAEQRLLNDSKTVFHQQLLSVLPLYKPRKSIPHEVLLVVLCGDTTAGVKKPNFPTLQDMENGCTQSNTEQTSAPLEDGVMDELYPRKTIIDNLKAYIKANSLMIPGAKGQLPDVKIEGVICEFASRGALQRDTIPLDQVESLCLRQFTEVCEIVMQTSISGSSITSSSIPPMRLVKNGAPPTIAMWTEKRAGNKTITIIKNLEALTFNLNMLCAAWRQKFSTSCTVFDPSVDMKKLKSGTKIPLEIHIQGDKTKELTTLFANDLGIPAALVIHRRS